MSRIDNAICATRKKIRDLPPGQRCIYHTGFLAIDADRTSGNGLTVRAVRTIIQRNAHKGFLTQKRLGPNLYEYRFTKRAK